MKNCKFIIINKKDPLIGSDFVYITNLNLLSELSYHQSDRGIWCTIEFEKSVFSGYLEKDYDVTNISAFFTSKQRSLTLNISDNRLDQL